MRRQAVVLQDLLLYQRRVQSVVGDFPSVYFEEQGPQCEDIHSFIVGFFLEQFLSHVHRCPTELHWALVQSVPVSGQSEIAKFCRKVLVDQKVMRFDIPMHDPVLMQVANRRDDLSDDPSSFFVAHFYPPFVNHVVKGPRLEEFCDNGQIRGHTGNTNEKDNGRVSKLGQHVDLITEFLEELFGYFGVEGFFHCNFKSFIHASVDGAEASHRNLLI